MYPEFIVLIINRTANEIHNVDVVLMYIMYYFSLSGLIVAQEQTILSVIAFGQKHNPLTM
jgi:hypothetical protein